jgi:hypothetical protein
LAGSMVLGLKSLFWPPRWVFVRLCFCFPGPLAQADIGVSLWDEKARGAIARMRVAVVGACYVISPQRGRFMSAQAIGLGFRVEKAKAPSGRPWR